MQEKIETARAVIARSRDANECAAAIAFLNEHADEHWTLIGGSWHRSHLEKRPVTLAPLPGDFAGIGY